MTQVCITVEAIPDTIVEDVESSNVSVAFLSPQDSLYERNFVNVVIIDDDGETYRQCGICIFSHYTMIMNLFVQLRKSFQSIGVYLEVTTPNVEFLEGSDFVDVCINLVLADGSNIELERYVIVNITTQPGTYVQ